jgi:hypothetical protein
MDSSFSRSIVTLTGLLMTSSMEVLESIQLNVVPEAILCSDRSLRIWSIYTRNANVGRVE